MFDQSRFDDAKAFALWLESFPFSLAIRASCKKCIIALWLKECGAEFPFAGVACYGIFSYSGDSETPLCEMEKWQKEVQSAFDRRASKDQLILLVKKYF